MATTAIKKHIALWSMCLLLFFSSLVLAQSPVRFSAITTAEGLFQNHITAITQDHQGFIWIGTPDGLQRYNGYSFTDYKHLPNDSTTLVHNYITTLCEDKEGNMWIGTKKGISKWIRRTDEFETLKFDETGAISHQEIQSLYRDNKQNIWVGSRQGLSLFNTIKGEWIHFAGNNQKLAALKDLSVSVILQDHKGDMWIGSDSLGLYRVLLAQTTGQVKKFGIEEGLADLHITSLASDKTSNVVWIGTQKGLHALHLDTNTFTIFTNDNKKNSLSDNHITGLLMDREGKLWIGTQSQGLNKYIHSKKGFEVFQKDVYNPFSLSDNTGIKVLFQDNTGIYWFGTAQGGINKYDPNRIKFRLYRSVNDIRKNGVQDKTITAFYRDNDGRLWIGTQKAGVFRYNPNINNGWFTQYSNYTDRLPSDNVSGIVQDLYGTMWVSTADRGVGRFSYKNGKLEIVAYRRHWEGLPSNRISTLFKDKRGEVWLLTFEGDLCKYDRVINDFTPKVEGNLENNQIVLSAKATDKNTIWVGTPQGAYLYDMAKEEIILDKRNDLKVWVSGIETVGDSAVWFSSSKGLIQYFPKNDSTRYFSRKDGLPSDMIYAVILGEDNNLWLSTSKGVAKFSLTTLNAKSYDETNGLQGNDFLAGSYYKSDEGEIFFGGSDGYNAFFPEEIKDSPEPPQLVFTDIEVFSKAAPLVDYTTRVANPLGGKSILVADSLTLNFEKIGFSLEFAALHFSDPKKNKYAYKMEGLDQTWTEVTAGRNFVSYPSLPYGNYVFRVKAANADGVWNEEGIALNITVLTPIWDRLWFRISLGLLALGIVTAIYMGRVRRIKNQKLVLENEVELRTHELKEKNDKMMDSLRYAERIQQAILPTETELKEHLPEVFTVYEPLDIVSGDFYWFRALGDIVYVAVVDCTGHGVPGAFMSMIGSSLLSDMVQQNRTLKPCETLELLNQKIRMALSQEDERNTDGMDVCFCKINLNTHTVWFTGAKRPLYITKKDGTFIEIKGDRKSVGGKQKEHKEFTTTEIQLSSGDMIYLTSDGYADQPNAKGKKFGSLRLQQLLKDIAMLPTPKQKQQLTDTLHVHKGSAKQRDDITIMGIRV